MTTTATTPALDTDAALIAGLDRALAAGTMVAFQPVCDDMVPAGRGYSRHAVLPCGRPTTGTVTDAWLPGGVRFVCDVHGAA